MKSKSISHFTMPFCLLAIFSTSTLIQAETELTEESTTTDQVIDIQPTHPMGQGRPPRRHDNRNVCEALMEGPPHSSEHGPLDNADLNRDGTLLRAELEEFMNQGNYRRITLLTFFEQSDTDQDGIINREELAQVNPPHSFNGTDANGDCVVSRAEVEDYVNEAGRSYRSIGLGKFFELVDEDSDSTVTPEEMEAAHESGLLVRF